MAGRLPGSNGLLRAILPAVVFALVAAQSERLAACTSVLVTRGASTDGSVMITYHCDDAGAFATLGIEPAADHKPGEMIEIPATQPAAGPATQPATQPAGQPATLPATQPATQSGTRPTSQPSARGPRGRIPQVAHTYKVVGGLINEHQVAMSETTFGGRKELMNPDGLLEYPRLMMLGLQRARTAREAIEVMTRLVAEYGYMSEGESISIADKQEAWILEIVGTGPGGKGGVWAAMRIPDGQISCHANQSRLGEIPRNDPDNCLFSENVESFAVSKGYYDPKSGKPFRFFEAYCPPTPFSRRICDARVWSVLRRAAPSKNFSSDYHRAKPGSEPYPLWLTPDRKLSVADVFALIRDHYEGTDFDTTQGVDAGPYALPLRWRPVGWKVDGVEYCWERPISTQQSAFTSVSQSRAWLPNAVGGLLWFGMDDSYTSCYLPFYCCLDAVPPSFAAGSIQRYSPDSAWWVFNLAANYANLKYSQMMPEIQAGQSHLKSLAEDGEQVVLTQAGPEAFAFEAGLSALVPGEQVESDPSDAGQILGRVAYPVA